MCACYLAWAVWFGLCVWFAGFGVGCVCVCYSSGSVLFDICYCGCVCRVCLVIRLWLRLGLIVGVSCVTSLGLGGVVVVLLLLWLIDCLC